MKLLILLSVLSLSQAFPEGQKVNRDISGRIIDGQQAYEGQFPYVAAIYQQTPNGTFFCGGTLVSNEWVLTAGFCAANATRFTIHLGRGNLKVSNENAMSLVSETYVLHPEFNPRTFKNNLALIKLPIIVPHTVYIQPVQRISNADIGNGVIVVAAGWGQTSDSQPAPVDQLNFVRVITYPLQICRQAYGSIITEEMLCVGGNKFQGTCKGDLGGPLILEDTGEIFTLLGVASFISGTQVCENTDPSGFTKIYPYRNWIINTIKP